MFAARVGHGWLGYSPAREGAMDSQVRTVRQSDDCGTFAMDGERPALIPPGVYDLKFLQYETALMFGRQPKLILTFGICSMGDHFEKRVKRFYNVAKLVGKPRRYGGFKAGWSGDFLREYAKFFRLPSRADRIP